MELQSVSIAHRFRGPARSGNGGYVCGLIGGKVQGTACVRLFAPPPLETELTLLSDADSVKLLHGEVLIGEARSATMATACIFLPARFLPTRLAIPAR